MERKHIKWWWFALAVMLLAAVVIVAVIAAKKAAPAKTPETEPCTSTEAGTESNLSSNYETEPDYSISENWAYFGLGEDQPVDLFLMGLCICCDARFPELFRLMVDQGAKMILVPAAFNMTTGPAHWELLFRQRAVDNQIFCVGTSPARDLTATYHAWGHSIVTDPWGRVVTQMDADEEIRIVELDLDLVDRIRAQLPLLAHRRTDVYRLDQVGAN